MNWRRGEKVQEENFSRIMSVKKSFLSDWVIFFSVASKDIWILNFTARCELCKFWCIPYHPPNDLPPTNQSRPLQLEPDTQDDAAAQDQHGGTQMMQKHQCTESPAPGDEEKLNISH